MATIAAMAAMAAAAEEKASAAIAAVKGMEREGERGEAKVGQNHAAAEEEEAEDRAYSVARWMGFTFLKR